MNGDGCGISHGRAARPHRFPHGKGAISSKASVRLLGRWPPDHEHGDALRADLALPDGGALHAGAVHRGRWMYCGLLHHAALRRGRWSWRSCCCWTLLRSCAGGIGSSAWGRRGRPRQAQPCSLYYLLYCGQRRHHCGNRLCLYPPPLLHCRGTESVLLDHCATYGRILLVPLLFYILQLEFHSFSLLLKTAAWCCCNTGMRYYKHGARRSVYGSMRLGLVGAAVATAISRVLGGMIPILHFSKPNASPLHFTKAKLEGKALLKACTNGSSEVMSDISAPVVGMLYDDGQ